MLALEGVVSFDNRRRKEKLCGPAWRRRGDPWMLWSMVRLRDGRLSSPDRHPGCRSGAGHREHAGTVITEESDGTVERVALGREHRRQGAATNVHVGPVRSIAQQLKQRREPTSVN